MFPIQPVSRVVDDQHDNGLLQTKRPPLVKPGKVEDAEDPEIREQEHSLDRDA